MASPLAQRTRLSLLAGLGLGECLIDFVDHVARCGSAPTGPGRRPILTTVLLMFLLAITFVIMFSSLSLPPQLYRGGLTTCDAASDPLDEGGRPGCRGAVRWSGLQPYPPLGATRSFSIDRQKWTLSLAENTKDFQNL